MNAKAKRPLALLALMLTAIFVCMSIAHGIQRDHGSIELSLGEIETEGGTLSYKLYKPVTATAENPAPGVLLLHGYQNDHETCAAYAIELARRGAVVMALDEYGHGATTIGMEARGYTNHNVKTNFGEDSEEDKTFVPMGGPMRYRLLLNFSNLAFFNDHYRTGSDGSSIKDSAMGGIQAYAALADMDCVDATRLALSGHSMGTWSSWSVAAAYAGATDSQGRDIAPKATVLQCGELFHDNVYDSENIYFNNVLLLQAKYDEFGNFRDYLPMVTDDTLKREVRINFLGCTPEESAWNTTFGSFEDGTARRMELLNTNHRLTTHNTSGMTAALDWFDKAIGLPADLASGDQVFLQKEWLVFAAMLLSIACMLPLMELLCLTPFFASVRQAIPDRPIKSGKKWWKNAVITVLIAGITYPFITQVGHALLPMPEHIFRMTIGNAFFAWYSLLILIMLLTTCLPWRKAKKAGKPMDYLDLGLTSRGKEQKLDWSLCGKSLLLVLLMTGFMYLLVFLSEKLFLLDFRFIWPYFKTFSLVRAGQFLVYWPVFALFFLLNNSKIFAQSRVAGTETPGLKAFLSCWWKYAFCMVGGVLLVILLEYIPFFAGIGPGADLILGKPFGGPFMSLLIVFAPQILVLSLLCTYCYRRTGSVYVGGFTAATLACWIITGGSAILF